MDPISALVGLIAGGGVAFWARRSKKTPPRSYKGFLGTVYIAEGSISAIGLGESLRNALTDRGMDMSQPVRNDLLAQLHDQGDTGWCEEISGRILHLVAVGDVRHQFVKRVFKAAKGAETFDEYILTIRLYGPAGRVVGGRVVSEVDYGAGKEEVCRRLIVKVMEEIDSGLPPVLQETLAYL